MAEIKVSHALLSSVKVTLRLGSRPRIRPVCCAPYPCMHDDLIAQRTSFSSLNSNSSKYRYLDHITCLPLGLFLGDNNHSYRNFNSCTSAMIRLLHGGNSIRQCLRTSSSSRLSNFDLVPFEHHPEMNSNSTNSAAQNISHVRNFSTGSFALGRHRTYSSGISPRVGIGDSQEWKNKHGEQRNGEHAIHSPSVVNEKIQNNYRYLNHRMSNIRIHLMDQNKDIKEKISVHRSKGEKAVRKLRRQLQAQVTQKEDIRTIPNLLTTLRMASAPVLAGLVVNNYFGCALSIFVVAGFTDLLDGYIARNFKNQRTALGTALDPLADKLLISCLTLSLTSAGLIPVPLTALILSRDAGLIIGSFIIRYVTLSPPRTLSRYFDVTHVTAKLFPSMISKINTGVQLSYVASVLASPVFGFVDHPLLQALMYTTAATTFLSGLDYVITWRRRLKIVKNN